MTWSPLLISLQRIRYNGHIQRRRSDSLLQKARNFRVIAKRRLGRPRFTFNDTLMHDCRKFPNVPAAEWGESLANVSDLKRLTSSLYARENADDDPLDADLMHYFSDEDE